MHSNVNDEVGCNMGRINWTEGCLVPQILWKMHFFFLNLSWRERVPSAVMEHSKQSNVFLRNGDSGLFLLGCLGEVTISHLEYILISVFSFFSVKKKTPKLPSSVGRLDVLYLLLLLWFQSREDDNGWRVITYLSELRSFRTFFTDCTV